MFVRYPEKFQDDLYRLTYLPVTAYTAIQPILVNGADINTGEISRVTIK